MEKGLLPQSLIRRCLIGLLLLTFLANSACQSPTPPPTPQDTGTVTIWGWDEKSVIPLIPEFNKVYPNIKINYVVDNEAMDHFVAAYTTGEELPDIIWIETQRLGKFLDMDIWERLDAPPYNADPTLVFPAFYPSMKNARGEIVGFHWDFPIAGLAYRQDVALKYLGTGDPDELEARFPTWEAFIAKGQEINAQNDGKVFMFASLKDAFRVIDGQDPKRLLDGDTIDLSGTLGPTYQKVIEMRDSGVSDTLIQWSEDWNNSIGDGAHIFYPNPTWFPSYTIEPNDPEGKGQWRMINPPGGGFYWGGTLMAIPQRSQNKLLAWKFLQWYLLTEEGARANLQASGAFIPLKSTYEDPTYTSYKQPWFGDQDLGQKWFRDIAPSANDKKPPSIYDQEISEVNNLIIQTLSADKTVTFEQAMELLKKELQSRIPDLKVK